MHYVISDIHGEYDLFMRLLEKIGFGSGDVLYCLGDFIEKGDKSREMLRFLRNSSNVQTLLGNHEVSFLNYYESVRRDPSVISRLSDYLSCKVSIEDMDFLDSLPLYIETDDIIMVHAGVELDENRAIIPMGEQRTEILIYDRRTKDADYVIKNSKTLIIGHTPTYYTTNKPNIVKYAREGKQTNSTLVTDYYKILVDIGTLSTHHLGCLRLEDMAEFYVKDTASSFWD